MTVDAIKSRSGPEYWAECRDKLLAELKRRAEAELTRQQACVTALGQAEQHARQLTGQSRALHTKLRHFSHRLLAVQEQQRKEISRGLHDEISQLLVAIKVQLESFTQMAKKNPQGIRQAIVPLRHLIKKSLRIVHQFARELRPAALDDLGLIPALRSYFKDLPRRTGRQIQFTAFAGVESLDNDQKTVLYRIAQEAVTNAAKHARASVVKVTIFKAPGGIGLEIADNGKGFDLHRQSTTAWSNHLGLVGMRERVEMVGGRFSIVSARGQGTTVRAVLPSQPGK